jgi:hypothetical protein
MLLSFKGHVSSGTMIMSQLLVLFEFYQQVVSNELHPPIILHTPFIVVLDNNIIPLL